MQTCRMLSTAGASSSHLYRRAAFARFSRCGRLMLFADAHSCMDTCLRLSTPADLVWDPDYHVRNAHITVMSCAHGSCPCHAAMWQPAAGAAFKRNGNQRDMVCQSIEEGLEGRQARKSGACLRSACHTQTRCMPSPWPHIKAVPWLRESNAAAHHKPYALGKA